MQPTRFISGLEICGIFFEHSVKPIFQRFYPHLKYTAALVGEGSEVLGFDAPISCDHDWGPRVKIFLTEEDQQSLAQEISHKLRQELPAKQGVYPTNFLQIEGGKTKVMQEGAEGNINHRVEFSSIAGFIREYMAFDIAKTIEASDWLSFSEQKLATIVGGKVFHDELDFEKERRRFSYYPHDIWLYLMACQWTRIEQEQHLMSQAGYAGDELGCSIIAARLVRDVMRLGFLLERTYAPYPKWFGSAFQKLNCASVLSPHLKQVMNSDNWKTREKHLVAAYELLALAHNELRISDPIPSKASTFFERPFLVISCGEASAAISSAINDPEVKRIAQKGMIGSLDQFTDSTDLISNPQWRVGIKNLYH